MRQVIAFLFVFSFTPCFSQDSSKVYTLHFKGLDSSDIRMASFKGKQILVVEFAASSPETTMLLSLDSLYRSRSTTLQIIGIPVNDANRDVKKYQLVKLLRDSLNLFFIIADVSKAKKNALSHQHSLLKWTTNLSLNSHFDYDIEEDGQMFIISKTGILYALLGKKSIMNRTAIEEVLDNQPLTN